MDDRFKEITAGLIGRVTSKTPQEDAQRQRVPLLSHQRPVLPRKHGDIEEPEMWPFYLYGRLIAVLEQGARAHGEVPWLKQYSPRQCR